MMDILVLGIAAIAFRGGGGLVRRIDHAAPLRVGGWLTCAVGGWVAAGASGAWFPIWPALVIGAAAGAIDLLASRRYASRASESMKPLMDMAVVGLCGLGSIPPVAPEMIFIAVTAFVILGWLLDQISQYVPRTVRMSTFSAPILIIATAAAVIDRKARDSDFGAWYRDSLSAIASIAITRAPCAARIELHNGGVAVIEHPRGYPEDGPYPGALVFHGNHLSGVDQPAAVVLRRALLDAGYVVLSVDHPGYGATTLPANFDDLEEWDPAPHAQAALKMLRAQPFVERIVAIGHSMGCLDVLRILNDGVPDGGPDAAIIFGLGVFVPGPSDEAWLRRFERSRLLPKGSINPQIGADIRRYYCMHHLVENMTGNAAPLIFVRFGMEHEDLVVGREEALRLLPRQPEIWDFDESTHYFSASERLGVIFGDVRVTRLLAERLGALRESDFEFEGTHWRETDSKERD